MQTFDLDKLMSLVDNKFHLVIGIVERVGLLKRGVEAKVPRRNRDLITVAIEEMENDLLSFKLTDLERDEVIKEHVSPNEALVAPEVAREEALAAQNATFGFGSSIDHRPLAMPSSQEGSARRSKEPEKTAAGGSAVPADAEATGEGAEPVPGDG